MIPREILKKIRQIELRSSFSTATLLSIVTVCGCREAREDDQKKETTGSFAGKLVTFDIPKAWVLQNHVTKTNSESFQFLIPDASTDGTPDSANAGIIIEKANDGVDITNYAESRLGAAPNEVGYAVLTKIFANDKWCSAMTRGQQETTPYIIMDRFGVDDGVAVLFRVTQPILTNGSVIAESISNFNSVVSSLKIGGTNTVNSEMRQDRGTIWLRAFSDKDTNWMTNNLTVRSPLLQK
jgi:hypothetical protein